MKKFAPGSWQTPDTRQKLNGHALLTQIIDELAELPVSEFAPRAQPTQNIPLTRHEIERLITSPHAPLFPSNE